MFCWQFVHHFSLWQALTWSLFQFFRNLLISSYARGWDKLEWERGWSSPLHPSISWMITTTDSWLWSLHFPPGKKQTGYIIMLTLSREIFFLLLFFSFAKCVQTPTGWHTHKDQARWPQWFVWLPFAMFHFSMQWAAFQMHSSSLCSNHSDFHWNSKQELFCFPTPCSAFGS